MDLYEDGRLQSGHTHIHAGDTERDVVHRSGSDQPVTGDLRTLRNLTALEKSGQVAPCFERVQTDIEPHMRKILAVWMFQVCEAVELKASVIELT